MTGMSKVANIYFHKYNLQNFQNPLIVYHGYGYNKTHVHKCYIIKP